jgi:hypothetical protein
MDHAVLSERLPDVCGSQNETPPLVSDQRSGTHHSYPACPMIVGHEECYAVFAHEARRIMCSFVRNWMHHQRSVTGVYNTQIDGIPCLLEAVGEAFEVKVSRLYGNPIRSIAERVGRYSFRVSPITVLPPLAGRPPTTHFTTSKLQVQSLRVRLVVCQFPDRPIL